jgi:hypothetical protein
MLFQPCKSFVKLDLNKVSNRKGGTAKKESKSMEMCTFTHLVRGQEGVFAGCLGVTDFFMQRKK